MEYLWLSKFEISGVPKYVSNWNFPHKKTLYIWLLKFICVFLQLTKLDLLNRFSEFGPIHSLELIGEFNYILSYEQSSIADRLKDLNSVEIEDYIVLVHWLGDSSHVK